MCDKDQDDHHCVGCDNRDWLHERLGEIVFLLFNRYHQSGDILTPETFFKELLQFGMIEVIFHTKYNEQELKEFFQNTLQDYFSHCIIEKRKIEKQNN